MMDEVKDCLESINNSRRTIKSLMATYNKSSVEDDSIMIEKLKTDLYRHLQLFPQGGQKRFKVMTSLHLQTFYSSSLSHKTQMPFLKVAKDNLNIEDSKTISESQTSHHGISDKTSSEQVRPAIKKVGFSDTPEPKYFSTEPPFGAKRLLQLNNTSEYVLRKDNNAFNFLYSEDESYGDVYDQSIHQYIQNLFEGISTTLISFCTTVNQNDPYIGTRNNPGLVHLCLANILGTIHSYDTTLQSNNKAVNHNLETHFFLRLSYCILMNENSDNIYELMYDKELDNYILQECRVIFEPGEGQKPILKGFKVRSLEEAVTILIGMKLFLVKKNLVTHEQYIKLTLEKVMIVKKNHSYRNQKDFLIKKQDKILPIIATKSSISFFNLYHIEDLTLDDCPRSKPNIYWTIKMLKNTISNSPTKSTAIRFSLLTSIIYNEITKYSNFGANKRDITQNVNLFLNISGVTLLKPIYKIMSSQFLIKCKDAPTPNVYQNILKDKLKLKQELEWYKLVNPMNLSDIYITDKELNRLGIFKSNYIPKEILLANYRELLIKLYNKALYQFNGFVRRFESTNNFDMIDDENNSSKKLRKQNEIIREKMKIKLGDNKKFSQLKSVFSLDDLGTLEPYRNIWSIDQHINRILQKVEDIEQNEMIMSQKQETMAPEDQEIHALENKCKEIIDGDVTPQSLAAHFY